MAVNQGGLLLKVIVFDPDLVWTGNRTDYLYLQAFFERSQLDSPFLKAGLPITQELTPILFDIDREWKEQKPGYQLLIKAHLLKLLAMIYRFYVEKEHFSGSGTKHWKNYHSIVEAVDYINAHYSEPLTLGQMAGLVHMSEHYFSSMFSQVMEMPFSKYVLEKRLTQAGMLLKTTDASVTEIALMNGFGSISYFNKMFRKKYGLPPIMYRREHRITEKSTTFP